MRQDQGSWKDPLRHWVYPSNPNLKPELFQKGFFKYYLIHLQFEIENLTSASPQMNWN